MADQTDPDGVTGACLCRAVSFTVTFPTLFFAHCHCRMCQRAHGAGYVSWIGVPAERFRIDSGEDALARFASSDHGTRSFCRHCGTSLLCVSSRHPDVVDVAAASLDGPPDRASMGHVWFDSHAPWIDVGDQLPRFGGADGMQPLGRD